MFVDYKILKMCIKQTIFVVLFSVVAMASAQSKEQLPEKVTTSEINAEVEKDDRVSAEDAEAIIEYNIYRKDHPDNPCARDMDTYDYEKSLYDETQIYINSRFCEPALWFDNFFATDRIYNEGVAGTYIRWRNEFTHD